MKNVIVTTDSSRRGVFFGELIEETKDVVILKNARMVVYWSADVKGVLGLAATGPTESCRITKEVPSLKINGVSAIIECAEGVKEKFDKDYWSE